MICKSGKKLYLCARKNRTFCFLGSGSVTFEFMSAGHALKLFKLSCAIEDPACIRMAVLIRALQHTAKR